jgi:ERCC4-related helicase
VIDPINDLLSDEGSLSSHILDDGTLSVRPWQYQLEMVQESLNNNIIIAMKTGCGKTHWYFCP